MLTNSSTMWTISLFHGANRCLISMVTCLLLSTRNVAFFRLFAQAIRLQAHFLDYLIKKICLNNADEFISKAFDDYYMLVGIEMEHLIARVHTHNGLVEAFIKQLKLIARPLLMRTKLPVYVWGHVVLHAVALVRIRQTANHQQSPFQLVLGQIPNLSHLRVFGCTVQVPIAPPQRTKMGPQCRSGIYIGFDSS